MPVTRAFGVAVRGALCAVAVAATSGEDSGWELLVTSAGPEVARTCFAAKGLPSWLSGMFLTSGPALFERGGSRFKAIFDGFGRANRFELRNKQLCFTSKWLDTESARAANASDSLGRGMFFMDTDPPRPPCPGHKMMCDAMAPNDNNWVNSLLIGTQAVMLSDTYKMLDMDQDTLTLTGMHGWDDDKGNKDPAMVAPEWVRPMHIPIVSSAHPLVQPGSTTAVDIVIEAPLAMGSMLKHYIDIYTFDVSLDSPQKRKRIASIKADYNMYFHSFGVSQNHIVLPFNIHLDMPRVLTSDPQLLRNFHPSWQGVHVFDFSGQLVEVFSDATPFFHTHIVNCFENASGIVLDIGASDEIPFAASPALVTSLFLNKTARDAAENKAEVRRYHFHTSGPLKGKTSVERFSNPGRAVDFFKINMAYSGLPYCIYYSVEWWHDGESYANMAILKHDLCKGMRTYWSRPNTYPGEPFFVAQDGGAEDDGVVIFRALDGSKRHDVFMVLDAKTMEEVEAVDVPFHIPFTAHGQFMPDRRTSEPLVV